MGGDLGQGEGKIMELLSSYIICQDKMSMTLRVAQGAMRHDGVPEFVLIAGHSIGIGLGPVMRLWDKMTQTEWVSVSQHAAHDNNIDDNDDLIPGTGQADDDWF